MLITLTRRTVICQSVAEVKLTGVAPLGAVSHILFNFNIYLCRNLDDEGKRHIIINDSLIIYIFSNKYNEMLSIM